ncbi:TPA: chloramphenicol phosphotransferase CPT family protein [Vibrio parahaemolyticus]|nr:hypothetical protein [uncultured Vibrio sp.]
MDVIILNGASSSGKSSIARELQSILPRNYLHIGIDTFISMMPDKSNSLDCSNKIADGFYFQQEVLEGKTVQRIQSGSYGREVNQAYHSTVKHLADLGLGVIVDDVMNGSGEQKLWNLALGSTNTLFVGVHCSLDVLTERERSRGDRVQGSAAEQALRVHQGVIYDLELSTSNDTAKECAQQIATHITKR